MLIPQQPLKTVRRPTKFIESIVSSVLSQKIKSQIRSSFYYNKFEAHRLAATSKRIDICAAQIAHVLHLLGHYSLSDKVCLEIGSGWVLSHAIIFHLLGAKRIIATDILPQAHPGALYTAIQKSVVSIPRDILSPFENHSLIRNRLDNLLSIKHFNFDILKSLGIEYISPIDFAAQRLNIPVDFIFSNSTLEDVPCEEIYPVLKNIVADLKSQGSMIHCIHLEDHRDKDQPFKFLQIPSSKYSRLLQTTRGNRIRKSGWEALFATLENTETNLLYSWSRNDKKIPEVIDSSVNFENESDLLVTHIATHTRKQ